MGEPSSPFSETRSPVSFLMGDNEPQHTLHCTEVSETGVRIQLFLQLGEISEG